MPVAESKGAPRFRSATQNQNLDLQLDALTKAGCERMFEEKKSGKAGTKRPEFESALAYLRPTDVLVVWKLDRLGRSLVEMMRTIDSLRTRGIHFRSLTEQIDSDTARGRFALQMHGAMAQCFLDLNRERTMESLKAGLARGRKGGRPRKITDADLEAGKAMLQAGTISVSEIAKRLGISRKTFYTFFSRLPEPMRRSADADPAPAPLALSYRLDSALCHGAVRACPRALRVLPPSAWAARLPPWRRALVGRGRSDLARRQRPQGPDGRHPLALNTRPSEYPGVSGYSACRPRPRQQPNAESQGFLPALPHAP